MVFTVRGTARGALGAKTIRLNGARGAFVRYVSVFRHATQESNPFLLLLCTVPFLTLLTMYENFFETTIYMTMDTNDQPSVEVSLKVLNRVTMLWTYYKDTLLVDS